MKDLGTAELPLEDPSGPTGKTKQFQGRASIRAWEMAGSLHVDLELPHLVAEIQDHASASWEEVSPEAHILLADTHVMGRAEMLISFLRVRYDRDPDGGDSAQDSPAPPLDSGTTTQEPKAGFKE